LQALETKRDTSLGEALSAQKGPLLDDKSRQTLEKVNAWIAGAPANAPANAPAQAPAQASASPSAPPGGAAPIAVNPKTGQKITLKNGQWVPVQ
jgi:hypothetical protein